MHTGPIGRATRLASMQHASPLITSLGYARHLQSPSSHQKVPATASSRPVTLLDKTKRSATPSGQCAFRALSPPHRLF